MKAAGLAHARPEFTAKISNEQFQDVEKQQQLVADIQGHILENYQSTPDFQIEITCNGEKYIYNR